LSTIEQEPKVKTKITPVVDNSKHDDFDWDGNGEVGGSYTDKEIAEYEKQYESAISTIEDSQIIQGVVVSISDSDVVVNIGFKSDGMVSKSEFRDMEDLKVGDTVDLFVVHTEDAKGQLVLSRKAAKLIVAWDNIVKAHEEGTIVKGKVLSKTKGGLIADVFGLETFLPGSQIDVKPITDYDAFVGKVMEFKVVKINETIKNAVVSHKALIESDLEVQRGEIMSKMEKGQVLEGVIKNITDFGAFIDLGGVDGLLYITDISWGRINHPSEVLELNQKINVVVLDFDDNKKRISLGLKQLTKHPWETLDTKLKEGDKVKGKIVNIEDYGAFLEITPGVEGLIHVSEISWTNPNVNIKENFKLNDELEAVVVTIDREERKMSLSIKRLTEDPWTKAKEKYKVGEKYKGIIKNITPYGLFIEFEDGIGGMVHVSDLSWTKRYNHPNEFAKVGDELEVVVLNFDEENNKFSLGHKQTEEDPWDTFETIFTEGSVHQATVIKKDDKGINVMLPYGLEAIVPARHSKKEDGSDIELDETLDFVVIEFNKADRKVIVSHTRVWEEEQKAEKREKSNEKKRRIKDTKQGIKNVNKKVEKTTLGDLDVFSDLKQKLEEEEGKDTKKKKK